MSVSLDDVTAVIVTRGDLQLRDVMKTLPYKELIIATPWCAQFWRRDGRLKDGYYNTGVEYFTEDLTILNRYRAADRARTPYVYFQDDDILFTNHDALLEAAPEDKLVCNMHPEWIESMGYHDLAMVGLGAICPTGLWRQPLDRYEEVYGFDADAKMYCDFIFTALCPWARDDFGHELLEAASAPNRLWRQGQSHLDRRAVVMNRARELRTVVLTMLVKNEKDTTVRAIESVKGLFDSVLVVDTGSDDGTPEMLTDYFVANGIDGEVLRRPWVDMAVNRQELLELGRTRGDYQLQLDADEEWIECPVAWPLPLYLDAYVIHYDGEIDFGHPRLCYSNYPWHYEGRVHAAMFQDEKAVPNIGDLPIPRIVHHGLGRHDFVPHVQKQIDILTEDIEAGINVGRNLFHRAKAYEGLGADGDESAWEKAIVDYEARVELSAGDEEAYYSHLRLGVLLIEQRGLFLEGLDHLVTAFSERPTRNEALRAVGFYCEAVADSMPYPSGDHIMVHRSSYNQPR